MKGLSLKQDGRHNPWEKARDRSGLSHLDTTDPVKDDDAAGLKKGIVPYLIWAGDSTPDKSIIHEPAILQKSILIELKHVFLAFL